MLNKNIHKCLQEVSSYLEFNDTCKVTLDMSYDSEEDFHHFIFLVEENYKKSRDLQDFLHEKFYLLNEEERKSIYNSKKLPIIFELSESGIKELEVKINELIV